MYLEERVEQLENAAVDQGRQIELVAGGLATLTVEVRGIRQDMTDGFAQVKEEFAKVRQEFADEFAKVNQRLDGITATQQLILTILQERMK